MFKVLCAKVTVFSKEAETTATMHIPVEEPVITAVIFDAAEALRAVPIRVKFCTLWFAVGSDRVPSTPELVGNYLKLDELVGLPIRPSDEVDAPETYFPGAALITRKDIEHETVSSADQTGIRLRNYLRLYDYETILLLPDGSYCPQTPNAIIPDLTAVPA